MKFAALKFLPAANFFHKKIKTGKTILFGGTFIKKIRDKTLDFSKELCYTITNTEYGSAGKTIQQKIDRLPRCFFRPAAQRRGEFLRNLFSPPAARGFSG